MLGGQLATLDLNISTTGQIAINFVSDIHKP